MTAAAVCCPKAWYSPQTAAYILQFMFALHTAGQDNPAILGPQSS